MASRRARNELWRHALLATLGWLFVVLPGRGAEIRAVIPTASDGWLSFRLSASELLDTRIQSTIESGLPGSCIYQLTLVDARGDVSAERLFNFTLRFDVWEERYLLEGPGGERVFESLAAADSAWAHPTGLKLVPMKTLRAEGSYRLRVEISVRSIARADRMRLAEFVSKNSSAGRQELHFDVGAFFARFSGGDRAKEAEPFESPSFQPAALSIRDTP